MLFSCLCYLVFSLLILKSNLSQAGTRALSLLSPFLSVVAKTTCQGHLCLASSMKGLEMQRETKKEQNQAKERERELSPGRQHKIGIIAVDYSAQWAAVSERFIHTGKEGLGRERKRGLPSTFKPLHSSPTVGTGMTSVA